MVEWLMALVLKTSDVRASVGSNPTLSVLGELAQLVERLLCKQDVSGSSPLFSIAQVAELVDALGLGSSRFICGGSSPLLSTK